MRESDVAVRCWRRAPVRRISTTLVLAIGMILVLPGVAVAATPLATPAAPSIVQTSPTSISGSFTPDLIAVSSTITLYDTTANSTTPITGNTSGTFTFSGLTTGDTYTATVTSIGDGSIFADSLEGSMSSPVTLAIPQLAKPPAPTLSQVSPSSITVTFTPDPNAVSSTITLNNTTANSTTPITGNTSGTAHLTGLTPGDTYNATITSIGDGTTNSDSPVGTASASVTLSLAPLAKPAAPTLSQTTPTSITVTFTPDPNAVSSTITLNNTTASTSKTSTGNVTGTHDFTGLTPGDSYNATIKSIGDGTTYSNSPVGTASASVTLSLTPLATPAAPNASQTTTTSITVTFTPDPHATSSTITLNDLTSHSSATDTGNVTGTHDFTGLTTGHTYDATITSIGDSTHYQTSSTGAASASVTLSLTPLAKPAAPTLSQTTPTSITVTFTPDPNAVSSTITLNNTTASTSTPSTGNTTGTAHFTGLTPGDTYNATIKSIGDGSNFGTSPVGTVSTPLTLVLSPLTQPPAPTLSQVSPSSITVTFTPDPNAVSSTITFHDTTANSTTPITGNTSGTFTFSGLTIGDTFTATITSIGDGVSFATSTVGAASAPLSLALLPLGTPQIVVTTQTNTSVTVSFVSVQNATSYTATVYKGLTVAATNSTTCVPAACVVSGLAANTSYMVVVTANGDHVTYNNSPPSAAASFETTSIGPANAAPPSDVTASSLGTPVSGTVSATTPTTITLSTSSTRSSITVPGGALPTGTTVSAYPITSVTTLASQLPANHSYVVAVAISWQTGTGTSPDATSPITLTIGDVSIAVGDTIYALTTSGMVAVGTATVSGEATVTFTTESVFIVSAIAKRAQFPLQVNSASAPVSHSVKLSTVGGSGSGAIIYNVTDGTAKGCALTSSTPITLSATTYGTCIVTAIKAADVNYGAVSSLAATVRFTPLAQASLTVSSAQGTVGKPFALSSTGGSGKGAVIFDAANGTATGCTIEHAKTFTLTSSSAGTCLVLARKSGDETHRATSSSRVAIRFIHPKVGAKPEVVAVTSHVSGGATTSMVLTGTGLKGGTISTTTKGVVIRVVKSTPTSMTLSLKVSKFVRSGVYHLTVANKSGTTTTTFRVVATPTVNVGPLINALFAGYREAWAVSATAGIIYAYQHDYPGSATSESAFLACYQKANGAQTGETDTPMLSTLRLTPTWAGPGPNTPAWNFAGKKPSGTTYSLTDDKKLVYASGPASYVSSTVHVTILNGVAYFYFVPAC
jgi:hypothetical protein